MNMLSYNARKFVSVRMDIPVLRDNCVMVQKCINYVIEFFIRSFVTSHDKMLPNVIFFEIELLMFFDSLTNSTPKFEISDRYLEN